MRPSSPGPVMARPLGATTARNTPYGTKTVIAPGLGAEDVDDAWSVIDEIVEDGDELALVLSDHRLPGKSGVDFLVELMKDERFGATRTVLVTGQAGLDYYIGKPWNPEELRAVVRDQLTEYVLESDVYPLHYVSVLDGVRVMEAIR